MVYSHINRAVRADGRRGLNEVTVLKRPLLRPVRIDGVNLLIVRAYVYGAVRTYGG